MTVTETASETLPAPPPRPPEASPTAVGWLDTVDHKRVGRLFVGLSLAYGVLALVLDALVKLDRVDDTGFTVFDPQTWTQGLYFSLDAFALLMLLPLFCGLAIYVVPLQLGDGTIAFPRLAAASFWGFAVASTVLIAAYAIDGGPGGGDPDGVELYLISLGFLAVSLSAAAVCIATTVIGLRPADMSLDRVPPFSWSAMVTAAGMLLFLPSLVGLLAYLYVDHRYGAVVFGGSDGLPAHLDWMHIHPQLLLLAVPALGVALEVVPVAARTRLLPAGIWQGAIGLLGVLSFGAWANQAIVDNVFQLGDSGRVIAEEGLYIGVTALAALAVLGTIATIGAAFRAGRPTLSPTLLLALASVLMLLGGITLAALGSIIDATLADGTFKLRDTAWRDGTYALIVLGGALGGLLAGVRWWAPKMYGRTLSAGAGYAETLLVVLGVTLIAVPSLVGGAWLELSYGPTHPGESGASAMAALTVAGSALLLLAVLIAIVDLAANVAGKGGDPAGPNPVGGHTLEWATGSPPPDGNFPERPAITSERPLLDLTEEEGS